MTAAGLDARDLLAAGDFSFASGERAARHLLGLGNPATAIIASNDQMALAALDVARDMELSVPDDLSIVSFDDTPIVHFAVPTLTAVDQPIAATASRAVELIIDAQRGNRLPDQPVVMPAALVRRQSTGPAPGASRR
jgi:LacI family transcriptional regulator